MTRSLSALRRRERGRMYEVPLLIMAATVTLAVTLPAVGNGTAGIGAWVCTAVAGLILAGLAGMWVAGVIRMARERRRGGP